MHHVTTSETKRRVASMRAESYFGQISPEEIASTRTRENWILSRRWTLIAVAMHGVGSRFDELNWMTRLEGRLAVLAVEHYVVVGALQFQALVTA